MDAILLALGSFGSIVLEGMDTLARNSYMWLLLAGFLAVHSKLVYIYVMCMQKKPGPLGH